MSDIETYGDAPLELEVDTQAEPKAEQEGAQVAPAPQAEPDQAEADSPAPVQEAEPEAAKTVPLAALLEVRRELAEIKRASQPAPPPPPDVFEDPQGFQTHLATTVAQQAMNVRLDLSEESARGTHGDAKVDEAFQAFTANADPATKQAILASRSPWNEVVKWHEKQTVMAKMGDDPNAWMAAKEAEIRAQIQAEMVVNQAKAQAATPAPSLANATGIGASGQSAWSGPTPLDEIFG